MARVNGVSIAKAQASVEADTDLQFDQASQISTAAGSLFLMPSTGRVGVGTTAPAVALDVIGTASFAGAEASLSQGNVRVGVDSGGDPGGELMYHTDDYVGLRCADSGALSLAVKPDGKVGIGTTSPAQVLDVIGVASFALAESSLSQGVIQVGVDSGGDPGGELMFHTDDYVGIRCANSGTLPLIVKPSGNVGIGVTDPDATLEVLDTTTQLKLSYDADSLATVTVADASHTTIATGEAGNLTLDSAGDITLDADSGTITFADGGSSLGTITSSGYSGTAATVTCTANNTADETVYPVFVDGATGAQGAETDTGLTYNPSSGLLTTAKVVLADGGTIGSASDTDAVNISAAGNLAHRPAYTSSGFSISGDIDLTSTATSLNYYLTGSLGDGEDITIPVPTAALAGMVIRIHFTKACATSITTGIKLGLANSGTSGKMLEGMVHVTGPGASGDSLFFTNSQAIKSLQVDADSLTNAGGAIGSIYEFHYTGSTSTVFVRGWGVTSNTGTVATATVSANNVTEAISVTGTS